MAKPNHDIPQGAQMWLSTIQGKLQAENLTIRHPPILYVHRRHCKATELLWVGKGNKSRNYINTYTLLSLCTEANYSILPCIVMLSICTVIIRITNQHLERVRKWSSSSESSTPAPPSKMLLLVKASDRKTCSAGSFAPYPRGLVQRLVDLAGDLEQRHKWASWAWQLELFSLGGVSSIVNLINSMIFKIWDCRNSRSPQTHCSLLHSLFSTPQSSSVRCLSVDSGIGVEEWRESEHALRVLFGFLRCFVSKKKMLHQETCTME